MDIIYIINKHINHQITDQSHYLFCFMSMVVINLWTGSCQFEIPGTQVSTYLAIAVCTLECVYVHD